MHVPACAEVAKLMADAGLGVLVSFISPFRAERHLARELAGEGRFCEVFVDTPLEVAEARDAKGLYQKARDGELANFTGVDSRYEPRQGSRAPHRHDVVDAGRGRDRAGRAPSRHGHRRVTELHAAVSPVSSSR